jgi:4-phospho-D-threonate 3-dehydrogenase / 4-phospho-D-erythronate 3-dehydrogenase
MAELPVIGITIGDAAGIGPEITVKAIADERVAAVCRPLVIGDAGVIEATAATLKVPVTADIHDLNNLPGEFTPGASTAVTGMAAGECIETAVELWRQGKVDAICTAPISKHSLALGGYDYVGHTEFLAALTDTKEFRMSFFADKLRVVLLSTHLPLLKAIEKITADNLVGLIDFTDRSLTKLLGRRPSIAVAGLNPHASEGGMFGTEEAAEITPAVERAKAAGINAGGPFSPDTIFLRGYRGEFDAVVSLYHDQATIAVKSLSFGEGVNVTLGLPLVRTSVDHGTAFDIAGKGIADASSMISAITLAAELVNISQPNQRI